MMPFIVTCLQPCSESAESGDQITIWPGFVDKIFKEWKRAERTVACCLCVVCEYHNNSKGLGFVSSNNATWPWCTLYCNPHEEQFSAFSCMIVNLNGFTFWLMQLLQQRRQEQHLWRRRAQHGHTSYKRDQTCDPLTMGLSVIASPPCLLRNIVQTPEKPGMGLQTCYFQVRDLKNCI